MKRRHDRSQPARKRRKLSRLEASSIVLHASCEAATSPAQARPRDESVGELLTCAVCCGPFRDCVAIVPCGHLFCHECVVTWTSVSKKHTCPTCRSSFVAPPVRIRAMDEVLAQLVSPAIGGESSEAESSRDAGACHVCSGAIEKRPECELCASGVSMCMGCADAYMGRCDACERWFCDACAGRECRWCRLRGNPSKHVCADCTQSALSQCPSPLNGGL